MRRCAVGWGVNACNKPGLTCDTSLLRCVVSVVVRASSLTYVALCVLRVASRCVWVLEMGSHKGELETQNNWNNFTCDVYSAKVVCHCFKGKVFVLLNNGLNKTNKQCCFSFTSVEHLEMSQWWPFPFKGGWAGTSFPTRGGWPPLHTPTGVGQTYAVSKAITIPRLKKRMAEWEREWIHFFWSWVRTLFWQTCVMQLFVSDVGAVCLFGFCFVLDKF